MIQWKGTRLPAIALSSASVMLLLFSLACASAAPTATPVAPAAPAPAVAPTAAASQAVATVVTGAPTSVASISTPAPTRVLPTATPISSGQPVYGGTLRHARDLGGIDTLDGHLNTEFNAYRIMYASYNNIVKRNPSDDSIGPELAKSWEIATDGKSVTFKLQEGVKFQDGTEFNAEALKWNIDRVLDPNAGSAQRAVIGPYIDKVEVVDKSTVVFRLKTPFRPLLALLTDRPGYVLSPAAVQKLGKDFGAKPVGTGPFKVVQWIPKADIRIEKFSDYWEKGKPYLDGIWYQNVPDESVRLAMLRTGETDVLEAIAPTQLSLIDKDPNIKVVPFAGGANYSFKINMNVAPFNSKALRQAIAYATDRKQWVDVFWAGKAKEAYAPIGFGWAYDPTLTTLKYDLAKAKEKLTEAGYPNGVTLTLSCSSTALEIQRCEIYQAQLAKANITVKLRQVAASDFFPAFKTSYVGERNYFGYTWQNPRPDPHQNLQRVFHTKGSSNINDIDYSNPQVDKLIDDAANVYDIAKARDMYFQMQRIIVEDVPFVFLVDEQIFMAIGKRVQNFEAAPLVFLRDTWLAK